MLWRKRISKSINIVQINICVAFEKKKVILANLFSSKMIHVALLQETRHKQETNLHITGYTAYPCNCRDFLGTITYIRNDVLGDVTHLPRAHPKGLHLACRKEVSIMFIILPRLISNYQIYMKLSFTTPSWQETSMATLHSGDIQDITGHDT